MIPAQMAGGGCTSGSSRMRRLALLAALAALVAAVVAPPAVAAKRKVPFGFFGVVVSPELSNLGPEALDRQSALMAASGVESARLSISWGALEPTRGVYSFGGLDALVGAMARHHIDPIVNVSAPPPWNALRGGPEWSRSPPRDPILFAKLFRELVLRYGPRGSFWVENPAVPRVPVREWQLWNEQNAPWHWSVTPWAPRYVKLLKPTYRAIHRADRGAKVIAGSLVAAPQSTQWSAMRALYRAGGKRYFDEIAIHPFTNNARSVRGTVDQVIDIVKRVRAHMRRYGDARKPVLITELTWAAAVGRVPKRAQFGLETTPKGQVQRLRAAYRGLAKRRRSLRISEVHWYDWASPYDNTAPIPVLLFNYTGLTRIRGSLVSPMPILRTFAGLAASYEGCRKSTNARRCR
jgi:Beta-galactosidase